jgi:hypothetical protein
MRIFTASKKETAMTSHHIRTGLITIAHGELYAAVPAPVPGQLSLPGPEGWSITPIPGGVGEGAFGGMSPHELRAYLNHGLAFTGLFDLDGEGGALTLTGARDLYPVQTITPDDRTLLDAIMSAAERIAGYRDARLKTGIEITIEDWQGVEREDKTTADNIRLTIRSEESRLLVTASDGRKLDLELQDGVLRALAYEAGEGKDSPVITALPPRGEIMIDREDYDRETRPAPDGPEM